MQDMTPEDKIVGGPITAVSILSGEQHIRVAGIVPISRVSCKETVATDKGEMRSCKQHTSPLGRRVPCPPLRENLSYSTLVANISNEQCPSVAQFWGRLSSGPPGSFAISQRVHRITSHFLDHST